MRVEGEGCGLRARARVRVRFGARPSLWLVPRSHLLIGTMAPALGLA